MTAFKTILDNTLPIIKKRDYLKEKYLELILNDMIDYDTKLKDYFNPQKVYKEFFLRFKHLSVLPDSLKFLKIFYFASKNIPLSKCVEILKDEIDVMNGYFEENLIEDIKAIRNELDIASFIIINFGYDEVKEIHKKNEVLEKIVYKIEDWNIENDFKRVIEWIDSYKNSMGIDEYYLLIDYLDLIFDENEINLKTIQKSWNVTNDDDIIF